MPLLSMSFCWCLGRPFMSVCRRSRDLVSRVLMSSFWRIVRISVAWDGSMLAVSDLIRDWRGASESEEEILSESVSTLAVIAVDAGWGGWEEVVVLSREGSRAECLDRVSAFVMRKNKRGVKRAVFRMVKEEERAEAGTERRAEVGEVRRNVEVWGE